MIHPARFSPFLSIPFVLAFRSLLSSLQSHIPLAVVSCLGTRPKNMIDSHHLVYSARPVCAILSGNSCSEMRPICFKLAQMATHVLKVSVRQVSSRLRRENNSPYAKQICCLHCVVSSGKFHSPRLHGSSTTHSHRKQE